MSITFSRLTAPLVSRLLAHVNQFSKQNKTLSSDKSRAPGRGKGDANLQASINRLILTLSALSRLLSAFRSGGSVLAACACHNHSFTLNCFCVWPFISIKGFAAAPFSLTTDWCDSRTVRCVVEFFTLFGKISESENSNLPIVLHKSSREKPTIRKKKKKNNTVLPT